MVVGAITLPRARSVAAVSRGDVGLHADDGFDALFPGGFVEGPCAEHAPVVRESEARHLVFFGLVHQVRDAVRSVEERKFGVSMEVNEAHVRRGRMGA